MAVESGLAVGRCGCAGFTTDAAAFAEAVPIVDVNDLQLRRTGDSTSTDPPLLAPVRDMFDEGRRQRDLSEFDGLPWRPPR